METIGRALGLDAVANPACCARVEDIQDAVSSGCPRAPTAVIEIGL